jgi:type IV pilus assembly protein PilB
MVLVTGPTGSGKTVTLYSALNYLNQPDKNISTVEDPIEIRLPGINQVNINPKIGLDFATVLRTFLRQDPDIIMIGEIRDTETANIAIQAAQTGHLVLSTLHTNSAIDCITRLQAMGILQYNIMGTVSLIIAQRLLRTLCEHCKKPETLPSSIYSFTQTTHSPPVIYCAEGCSYCHHGYSGRTAIYEFLVLNESIAKHIISGADTHTLSQEMRAQGFVSLKEGMLQKVFSGITSFAEINRVLQI